MDKKILVGIIMGSDSDLEAMKETARILAEFDIPHEINIISAHRTPQRMYEYATSAVKRGLEVIIAGAGGAAHLPGMTAANTVLPVIGVPIESRILKGVDSLLSIVQMPKGVPVATMAIGKDGARNAGILSAQILGIKYPEIREKVKNYKERLAKEVEEKAERLKKNER
ncbi:MAG: 5-(carboxyamino)imidazole ribonucleotide mutase [Candidatus Omnitrophica bacterium]|nr:5-(carboxyamino)imidazole ribonucleotide mutase [Candidatus Omnitrophota bacterium]MBU0878516.1 5-(carboxyamino)imidazole ribonucleotide mutase [Candidatus Omnitrophota bacterium]MBU0896214.1 5-(carboxyamino)imidazole ribonucleotide mutase [Candidatus Omnitrophota bacterium]MBU1133445.1 5-(carboxyamino)imidazole ribonucleotide mutase [Candidatus Omnitrophota bacterium]MBU1366792.1 5-(carboxyamino)imidazole ribonucleotide mutase [Candidatus Omnitrophota bacterium]